MHYHQRVWGVIFLIIIFCCVEAPSTTEEKDTRGKVILIGKGQAVFLFLYSDEKKSLRNPSPRRPSIVMIGCDRCSPRPFINTSYTHISVCISHGPIIMGCSATV
ncbi:hypothetical protein BDF14DRAFT_1515870 [Spinellus fusiger]|nr:hypothetical protein BDF14DRAFT_1515870 [Spinellus fusiger]